MRDYSTNYEDYQEFALSCKAENKEIVVKIGLGIGYAITDLAKRTFKKLKEFNINKKYQI